MPDLFFDSGASFNGDRTKRLHLWRTWDVSIPSLIMIMMNPSKADEEDDDPTVSRCVQRARMLGYGGVHIYNIMDVIETDSKKLDQIPKDKLCSTENVSRLIEALDAAANGHGDICCAWGKPGQKYGAVAWLATQAHRRGVVLYSLGRNKDGSPVHPLYIPYSRPLEWFAGKETETN